jgi:signal transduction histidine kinase
LQLTRNIKAKNGQASIFQIPITVLPAYYQTIWFKILMLLIITAIIILIIKYRQRQLDKERNLRTKIAGDLHDEIGSSLTRIWHQAQRIRLGDFNRTPSDSRLADQKKLQHIAATSQEAIAMLSDMVWSIDAQFDTLDELLVRMRTYVYQLQNDYDIAIKMVSGNVAKDRKVSQIVRQNLLLLFKEAINNAIKYGDGALINITIDMDTRIKMEITNTFDEQTKKTSAIGGRGLENMQRRVNKMHGELKIDRHDNLFRLVIIV